ELLFAKVPVGFPLNLSVMRYGSAFLFLTFLIEILNEVKGRDFEVVQRQGALLLVEKGKFLYLHLPSDGVDLEAFLGQY
nr:non-canonical purine NTP pyrophosphatase [Streptococcus parasanguinis]